MSYPPSPPFVVSSCWTYSDARPRSPPHQRDSLRLASKRSVQTEDARPSNLKLSLPPLPPPSTVPLSGPRTSPVRPVRPPLQCPSYGESTLGRDVHTVPCGTPSGTRETASCYRRAGGTEEGRRQGREPWSYVVRTSARGNWSGPTIEQRRELTSSGTESLEE